MRDPDFLDIPDDVDALLADPIMGPGTAKHNLEMVEADRSDLLSPRSGPTSGHWAASLPCGR